MPSVGVPMFFIGDTVRITVTFRDGTGAAFNPTSAVVNSLLLNGSPTTLPSTPNLVKSGTAVGVFEARITTDGRAAGTYDWTILAALPTSGTTTETGTFVLTVGGGDVVTTTDYALAPAVTSLINQVAGVGASEADLSDRLIGHLADAHAHDQYATRVQTVSDIASAIRGVRALFTDLLASKVSTSDTRMADARTPLSHTHLISNVIGLSDALAAKISTTDARLTNARTPVAHHHPESDVDGLTTSLAGKVDVTDVRLTDNRAPLPHVHSLTNITGLTAALNARALATDARFADARTPKAHSHPVSDITSLTSLLAAKVATTDARLSNARTPLAHSHAQTDVTGLVAALAAKVATNDARLTNARTPLVHTHTQAQVTGLGAALSALQPVSAKGAHNGYAGLDGNGLVPLNQLPRVSPPTNFITNNGNGRLTITLS